VKYIEAPYEPHKFMKMVKDKELADEKEGGLRCTACFEMRLDIVAKAAVEHGYD
jgi:predicted adenine nucleotide alpha hydrolase (AANH) superfamily ATPase